MSSQNDAEVLKCSVSSPKCRRWPPWFDFASFRCLSQKCMPQLEEVLKKKPTKTIAGALAAEPSPLQGSAGLSKRA